MNRYKNGSYYRKKIGIETIWDIILYQYAKIMAKRTFNCPNGIEAKKKYFGFIREKFSKLKNGNISWSEITREDKQFVETEKKCIYCGAEKNLHWEHIVPRSIDIKPECKTCNKIQGIHNQIWACKQCNFAKGTMGLYEFYKRKDPNNKKFYDFIPLLLEKKYLKTIYNCHKCAGTLDKGDLDGDKVLTVLDIDFILHGS